MQPTQESGKVNKFFSWENIHEHMAKSRVGSIGSRIVHLLCAAFAYVPTVISGLFKTRVVNNPARNEEHVPPPLEGRVVRADESMDPKVQHCNPVAQTNKKELLATVANELYASRDELFGEVRRNNPQFQNPREEGFRLAVLKRFEEFCIERNVTFGDLLKNEDTKAILFQSGSIRFLVGNYIGKENSESEKVNSSGVSPTQATPEINDRKTLLLGIANKLYQARDSIVSKAITLSPKEATFPQILFAATHIVRLYCAQKGVSFSELLADPEAKAILFQSTKLKIIAQIYAKLKEKPDPIKDLAKAHQNEGLVTRLGLQEHKNDPIALKKALRKVFLQEHPDKNKEGALPERLQDAMDLKELLAGEYARYREELEKIRGNG